MHVVQNIYKKKIKLQIDIIARTSFKHVVSPRLNGGLPRRIGTHRYAIEVTLRMYRRRITGTKRYDCLNVLPQTESDQCFRSMRKRSEWAHTWLDN